MGMFSVVVGMVVKLLVPIFLYINMSLILNIIVGWAGGGRGMGVSQRRSRDEATIYSITFNAATHHSLINGPSA